MARPLRIEFENALYHVTSRGDRRESIFEEDEDRVAFLNLLGEVVDRFNWICPAYCLMDNHYHLIIQTPDGNLSKGMRQLNGVFTQASNRKYKRSGHLFQGRYKAILVDTDSYLLELARYVVLNPVRANRVQLPDDYAWSSYRATLGVVAAPGWLNTPWLLAQFNQRKKLAQSRYQKFVHSGMGLNTLWDGLRQQIYLGDEAFVSQMQGLAQLQGDRLSIPRVQRRAPALPLDKIEQQHKTRNEAIVAAYATGAYSYQTIANYYGLHLATVGRIIRRQMQQCEN